MSKFLTKQEIEDDHKKTRKGYLNQKLKNKLTPSQYMYLQFCDISNILYYDKKDTPPYPDMAIYETKKYYSLWGDSDFLVHSYKNYQGYKDVLIMHYYDTKISKKGACGTFLPYKDCYDFMNDSKSFKMHPTKKAIFYCDEIIGYINQFMKDVDG